MEFYCGKCGETKTICGVIKKLHCYICKVCRTVVEVLEGEDKND